MTTFYKRITGSQIQGDVSSSIERAGTLIINPDNTVHVHDGSTPGGLPIGGSASALTSGTYAVSLNNAGVLTLSSASTILGAGTDPNVYIETLAGSTASVWTFSTSGQLTLPGATPIINGGGTGTDVTIYAGTATGTSTWAFKAGGTLSLDSRGLVTVPTYGPYAIIDGNLNTPTTGTGVLYVASPFPLDQLLHAGDVVTDANGLQTPLSVPGVTSNNDGTYNIFVPNSYVGSASQTLKFGNNPEWQFGVYGTTTLPTGSSLISSGSIISSTVTNNVYSTEITPDGVNFVWSGQTTGNIGKGPGGFSLNGDVGKSIYISSDNFNKTWQFDTTGALVLPNGTKLTTLGTGTIIVNKSSDISIGSGAGKSWYSDWWADAQGLPEGSFGSSSAYDSQGNLYVVGSFWSIGPYFGVMTKHDSEGNMLWNISITLSDNSNPYFAGESIVIDSSDNVYIVANDARDGVGYVLKFDSNGNLLNQMLLGAPGWWFQASDLTVDNSGEVYIIGTLSSSGSNYTSVVASVDPVGQRINWETDFGNGYIQAFNQFMNPFFGIGGGGTAIVSDSAHLYVTGQTGNGTDAPVLPYVVKINKTDGSVVWTQTPDMPAFAGLGIQVDSYGNVYVLIGNQNNGDNYVLKFDSTGTPVWKSSSQSPFFFDITIGDTGLLYITGASYNSPSSPFGFQYCVMNSDGYLQGAVEFTSATGPGNIGEGQMFTFGHRVGGYYNGVVAITGYTYTTTSTNQNANDSIFTVQLVADDFVTSGTYGSWTLTPYTNFTYGSGGGNIPNPAVFNTTASTYLTTNVFAYGATTLYSTNSFTTASIAVLGGQSNTYKGIINDGEHWTFGLDRAIKFPDGTRQHTAWTGPSAVTQLTSSTYTLSLDSSGNLALPNSAGQINTSDGNVDIFATAHRGKVILTGATASGYDGGRIEITGGAGADNNGNSRVGGRIDIAGGQGVNGGVGGFIRLSTYDSSSTEFTWVFDTDGRLNASGQINISSTDTTDGGTGYTGMIKLINAVNGASNPNKSIRISNDGNLQIINNAYNANIFDLADNGNLTLIGSLTLPGNVTVNSNITTNNNTPLNSLAGAPVVIWTASNPNVVGAQIVCRSNVDYGGYFEMVTINVVALPQGQGGAQLVTTGQIGTTSPSAQHGPYSPTAFTAAVNGSDLLYVTANNGGNDANFVVSVTEFY